MTEPQARLIVNPDGALELAFEQWCDAFFDPPMWDDPAWVDEWFIYAHAGMDLESCQIVDPDRFAANERDYHAYTQAVA